MWEGRRERGKVKGDRGEGLYVLHVYKYLRTVNWRLAPPFDDERRLLMVDWWGQELMRFVK